MPDTEITPTPPPAPGVPVADVKDLVDSFKATLEGVKETIAASRPLPPVPADNSAANRAAAIDQYNKTREKVNELIQAGDGAAAMEQMYGAFSQLQAATAVAPENDPSTKALISNAKRSSRADHKPLYDKYSGEIEAVMASRPLAERISPDAWDKAVADVRAMHFDDILAETKSGWEKEQREAAEAAEAKARGFRTPVASGGSHGTVRDEMSASDLTSEQIAIAAACNRTPEQYAALITKHDKAQIRPGRVALLDEPVGQRTIERGKF